MISLRWGLGILDGLGNLSAAEKAARMFAALNKFAMLLSKKGERMKRSQTTHRSMFTVRYRLSFLINSLKSEQNLGRKVELCSSDKSRVKISEFPFSKVELLIFSLTKKS